MVAIAKIAQMLHGSTDALLRLKAEEDGVEKKRLLLQRP
jgi:hypothetical protein